MHSPSAYCSSLLAAAPCIWTMPTAACAHTHTHTKSHTRAHTHAHTRLLPPRAPPPCCLDGPGRQSHAPPAGAPGRAGLPGAARGPGNAVQLRDRPQPSAAIHQRVPQGEHMRATCWVLRAMCCVRRAECDVLGAHVCNVPGAWPSACWVLPDQAHAGRCLTKCMPLMFAGIV